VQFDESRGDGQSQPGAFDGLAGFCAAVERFEDAFLIFEGDSLAIIAYFYFDFAFPETGTSRAISVRRC
jgi:hypothetical protein